MGFRGGNFGEALGRGLASGVNNFLTFRDAAEQRALQQERLAQQDKLDEIKLKLAQRELNKKAPQNATLADLLNISRVQQAVQSGQEVPSDINANIPLSPNVQQTVLGALLSRQKDGTLDDLIKKQRLENLQLSGRKSRQSLKQGKEKKFTDAQKLSAGFARRAMQAEEELQDLFKTYDPTAITTAIQGSSLYPEMFRSEGVKRLKQAGLNFITANLRKESGAAIPESEIEAEFKKYFPAPNDSKRVLAQKQRARKQVVESLKASAGGALEEVPQIGLAQGGQVAPPQLNQLSDAELNALIEAKKQEKVRVNR